MRLWMVLILLTGTSLLAHALANAAGADADKAVYNAEETYERTEGAVFYIRALNGDDTLKAAGTGVMISPDGIAATAFHVIADAERIEAVFNDGRIVSRVEVLGSDELTDAAVLKFPASNTREDEAAVSYANVISLRETAVKHGEKVFAIGYPMKDTPIITEGIVNTPKAEINGRERILTSAQIVSGMSGGPVIDRYGRLAGIVSGSMRTMNNVHLVIPLDQLRSLLPESVK
ncbi:S1C family serine protease [Paenibacillus thalictri]|nr:serine protease [Paenibacillus thalictri]